MSVAGSSKTPTIQDVAETLGLHMSTVSLALSGKGTISAATRQKVLTAARALGYQPNPLAQRLAGGFNNNLVCILSSPLDMGLRTEKLLLIQNELVARSLEVPLHTYAGPRDDGEESQERFYASQVRQVRLQRPRAIVCAGPVIHSSVFPELEAYQREGGIVISYDMPVPLDCDQVIYDRENNAYQAARCLLEQGHRHIGFVMSTPPTVYPGVGDLSWSARVNGFRRALEEFVVPFRAAWIFRHAGAYEAGGEDMARQFLTMPRQERPTGLCIVNDYVAMAFMVNVMRAGVRVPEDISIVSHDNQRITALCPVPMSSMVQPIEAITSTVIRMLMERIAGFDGPPRQEILRGELVARQSVVAPPNC